MRNIKIILEYDGSAFFGFQKQPDHPTVQEALEKALSQLLDSPTKIQAASGRTDTGVHAEYQVVNFKTEKALPLLQIQRGLNRFLPPQIAVTEVKEEHAGFHSRFSVKSKIYEYRVWNSEARSPLKASRSFHVHYPLDLKLMKQGARLLVGKHDFKSFASLSKPSGKNSRALSGEEKNTVRTIKSLIIKKEGDLIRIRVEADGFLYRMVRNIAGTLIEMGRGKISVPELRKVMAGTNKLVIQSAPACGLTLADVLY